MPRLILNTVGQHLATELVAIERELRQRAVVYSFATTDELLAAWRIARRNRAVQFTAPAAVVWLQSRPGEFAQSEVETTHALDPLARRIVIAGCLCEGEPRSGKLLTGVTRLYWHQGLRPLLALLEHPPLHPAVPAAQWIAIHSSQLIDYQGLAGLCQSLGHHTLWQADRWPVISSEPHVRIFPGWPAWEAWRELVGAERCRQTAAILLLNFPRPIDQHLAREQGIASVLAQPVSAADLQRAITGQSAPARAVVGQVSYLPVTHRRKSA